MKPAVLVLVLAAACQADVKDYPLGGGGGGVIIGGGGTVDGGSGDGDAGDGGLQVTGQVCLLSQLRLPTLCDPKQNALGLRVSLGTRSTTTTDAAGHFTIAAPQGAGFTWHVKGNVADRIIDSVMPFGTVNTIPAIATERYQILLNANSTAVGPLQGSIVVRMVRDTGVTGITAALAGVDQIFYDSNSDTDWNTGTVGTGAGGVVWIPGVTLPVPATTALRITLSPPGAAVVTTPAVVEDRAITFVTQDLQ